MMEATSCGGVVIFRGKILLLYKNYKNKYEGWVLPKGTVEQGEEYKDTDGTGPPGGPSGDNGSGEEGETIWDKLGELLGSGIGGILKLAEAVISGLLDALISLVDMLTGKLADVVTAVMQIFAEVPQLFSGFLGFLSAVFPFFPPEIMLLLTFGIAAVVFVGIIKAIRR